MGLGRRPGAVEGVAKPGGTLATPSVEATPSTPSTTVTAVLRQCRKWKAGERDKHHD